MVQIGGSEFIMYQIFDLQVQVLLEFFRFWTFFWGGYDYFLEGELGKGLGRESL